MNNPPPVSFSEKIKQSTSPSGGYPLQISAGDLDRNFVYATLQVDPGWLDESGGAGGNAMRTLKLPALQASGTYVLGTIDGVIQWIETEDC
jgi:hypothetical protein